MKNAEPDGRIVVFTDGAAKGNPGPGGWGAVILMPDGHVHELGHSAIHATNNQMELTAPIEALRWLRERRGEVEVYTDSTYLVQGMRSWMKAWKRRGWKTVEGGDVMNRDLWERLDHLVAERGAANRVYWHHVRGHAGELGNERADLIASAFASGRSVELYRGRRHDYSVPIRSTPARTAAAQPGRRSHAGGKKRPHSYLSVVDGRPMRHASWGDCEKRVKGKSGARFKKAMSPADEAAILARWGFRLDDLR